MKPATKQKVWEIDRKIMDRFLNAHDLRTLKGKRNKAVLVLLARSGMRRKELCGLKVGDFDPEQLTIRVETLKQRSKGKSRTLPLPSEAVQVLQTYLASRGNGKPLEASESLFHLTPVRVNYIVKKTRERAGIQSNITPHSLRHNLATKILRTEGESKLKEIQELLGHKHIQTTDIYLHSNPGRLREAVDRVEI